MKFVIADEIFNIFPHLRIGVVVGRGLKNQKDRLPNLDNIIQENTGKLLATAGDKTLTDFAAINAWRETYRAFGVSPKKYKPTAEAFLKRIIKGKPFPNINAAVDAYLAVELLYMLPIGGYDLDNVSGDITLRTSEGNEEFLPLGGENSENTAPGEIVYVDEKIVLTRNWNYRDSDLTKITQDTRNILLASEAALETIGYDALKGTVETIAEYESDSCGGEYSTFFLDRDNPVVEF